MAISFQKSLVASKYTLVLLPLVDEVVLQNV